MPFGWSHSRQKMLDECPRRYFYTYYAAPLGRSSGQGEEEWLASVLKRLTTYELVLGQAVHDRAREILTTVRSRRPRPDLKLLLERTRSEMNRVYRISQDRRGFLYAADRRQMLLAIYYGRDIPRERLAALRERMHCCLANLHESPVWEELETGDPSLILAVDRICEFSVDGVVVYVAPDLIYRTQGGECVVCDWKTGSCKGAWDQLALYCLYARDCLGICAPDGIYRGRVFDLARGTIEEHLIAEEDLAAALSRVRDGIREMRTYVADVERNSPRDKQAFPITLRRMHCSRCSYLELCASELGLPQVCGA